MSERQVLCLPERGGDVVNRISEWIKIEINAGNGEFQGWPRLLLMAGPVQVRLNVQQ